MRSSWFRAKTRFHTEAKRNSEIAYTRVTRSHLLISEFDNTDQPSNENSPISRFTFEKAITQRREGINS